jgi:pyruvate/2-oxoglutarate/acetoin dehydrogenase E1 component
VSSSYIEQIIEQINQVTENCGPVLLYGENIDTGSRIGGLARGLKVNPAGRILNVGNCELTHIGVGLGMMLDGGNAAVFMKQLDFLPLGLDQMVNTFNYIRAFPPENGLGSFTIFPIVCDQGYQGPQSSINVASDFASMANIDIFCLNGAEDASMVIRKNFVSPGFRVVCTSQRLFGSPALDLPIEAHSSDNAIFKYRSGDDVTIVCYNFSLRDGVELAERLSNIAVQSDLFHVNFVPDMNTSLLSESCARTNKVVLIDDSKSVTKFSDMLVRELQSAALEFSVLSFVRRGCSADRYGVVEDQFLPDYEAVRSFVGRP